LAERNIRTRTNTVHLSLNFDITENLDNELLTDIAAGYMDKIGFGHQPYLVYKHFDAGHPHIHIVTTNIDPDGQRISLHNIGRLKSEPARKEIEIEFGLVQADSKMAIGQIESSQIKPLEYGSTDTKRAMSNIVNEVIHQYQFTSLPEFNAVLKLYNLEADRGSKESVMFDKGGLRYWAIDNKGYKLGVPIKASSIYKKPTLKLLEDRFRLGEYLRRPFKAQIKKRIDDALATAGSKDEFLIELKRAQISGIFRQNADGRTYGVTYIDTQNKVVFNGSDLGKNYSAAAVVAALQSKPNSGSGASQGAELELNELPGMPCLDSSMKFSHSLLDDLLSPIDQNGTENLFERKKKKKRKKLTL